MQGRSDIPGSAKRLTSTQVLRWFEALRGDTMQPIWHRIKRDFAMLMRRLNYENK